MIYHYYNDIDPNVCEWLKQLIRVGAIQPGVVDNRSITEVDSTDLKPFRQCHFFCGIAGWPLALQLAGVPPEFPLWTGSAPCQPFSVAGKRKGTADERHLWPIFYRLIQESRPPLLFGEQVSGNPRYQWWDIVANDLEDANYTPGAVDLPVGSIQAEWSFPVEILDPATQETIPLGQLSIPGSAPHIRSRLFWMAYSNLHDAVAIARRFSKARRSESKNKSSICSRQFANDHLHPEQLVHTDLPESREQLSSIGGVLRSEANASTAFGKNCRKLQTLARLESRRGWNYPQWLECLDGTIRPVSPFTPPLVDGLPQHLDISGSLSAREYSEEEIWKFIQEVETVNNTSRLMQIKGYGNAISPPVAAEFIKAGLSSFMELTHAD